MFDENDEKVANYVRLAASERPKGEFWLRFSQFIYINRTLKNNFFFDMTPCRLTDVRRRFEGICCLHNHLP
jgi:hypothetical protein